MSRFDEAKRLKYIETTEQRMSQASQQIASFCQSVFDVNANWQGYVSLETDATELQNARIGFATRTRQLVDDRKTNLAHALDIIAGGSMDADGNPLTRQDLINELVAVPAAE